MSPEVFWNPQPHHRPCAVLCIINIHMRMHIDLDDTIVTGMDAIAGLRRRSAFVREAILAALDRHRRTGRLRQAAGMFRDSEHDWDADPVAWVSRQHTGDSPRVGFRRCVGGGAPLSWRNRRWEGHSGRIATGQGFASWDPPRMDPEQPRRDSCKRRPSTLRTDPVASETFREWQGPCSEYNARARYP